jgi:iron complex outermembrane receptor protein
MIYGSFSRGFKSGNYNVTAPPGSMAVNPEFIDAYEVGLKTQIFDNRVQINTAAFYYDYADMQVTRIESGSLITVNAAEAKIKGLEMDFQANLTNALSLKGGISYVDSEYTSFENAPVYVPSATGLGGNDLVTTDLSGKTLARSPELTYNLGATYNIADFMLGVNYYYNDGFGWEPSGRVQQDSYELINAFVSWTSPDEHWGVKIFGNNLTDEEYATFVTEQSVADNYEPAAPRTYGVEFSFNF